MSYRQSSVFKIQPKRASSFIKCVVEQSSRSNQLSNYSKVMNFDGLKTGDINKLQNHTNLPQKENKNNSNDQTKFHSKLLNFLMVAVKTQCKNDLKKKQSTANQQKTASNKIFKNSKSHSLGEHNAQVKKKMKMEQIFNVKKKQIVEENSSNCLKNQKLLNIKFGISHTNEDSSFVTYNKQFLKQQITSNMHNKRSQSPTPKTQNYIQQNQDYLTSQIGDLIAVTEEKKISRIKTQGQKRYLLDAQLRQYLPLDKEVKNQHLASKSQENRAFSANYILREGKNKANAELYLEGGTIQKQKASSFYDTEIFMRSVFDNKTMRKSINSPYNLIPMPKRLPIYSRKKRYISSSKGNNQQIYFDSFITTHKGSQGS